MRTLSLKRQKSMTAKERDQKARRLLGISGGAYAFAYFYLFVCSMINVPESVAGWGFVIFTMVGAGSAWAYSRLPGPWISPECLAELEKMLEGMKEENKISGKQEEEGVGSKTREK